MKPCRLIVLIGLFVWAIHGGNDSFADDGLQVRVRYRALGVAESPTATPPVIEKTVEGRIRVQAQDGGLLLEDRQGTLWPITASQTPVTEALEAPFTPLTADELTASLQAEFGEGFQVVRTPHYLICTNAGAGYGECAGNSSSDCTPGSRGSGKTACPD